MFSKVRGLAGSDCRNRYVGSPQPPRFGQERPLAPFIFVAGPGEEYLSSPGLQISDTGSQISRLCSGSTTVRPSPPPVVAKLVAQRTSLAMYMYWPSRTCRAGCRAAAAAARFRNCAAVRLSLAWPPRAGPLPASGAARSPPARPAATASAPATASTRQRGPRARRGTSDCARRRPGPRRWAVMACRACNSQARVASSRSPVAGSASPSSDWISLTALPKLLRGNISCLRSVPVGGGGGDLGGRAATRVVCFVEERAQPAPRAQNAASGRSGPQAQRQAEHARVGLAFPGNQ